MTRATSTDASGGTGRTYWVLGIALALTVVVAVLATSGPFRPPLESAGPTSASTPAPTAAVACREEPGDLARGLIRPACPSAFLAVELAVAPVRLRIERIVIEPGPLFCDLLWPGVQSVPVCRGGYAVLPGQFMHAWVSFTGSPKVAVVMLGLDLPEPGRASGGTRPPWMTTLVTVETPPSGWVMR